MRIKMFLNDPPSLYPSTFIDSCYMNSSCSIDEIRNSYLRLQTQSTTNKINRNIYSMLQSNVYSRTADTMAIPYYGLNKECINVYGKPNYGLNEECVNVYGKPNYGLNEECVNVYGKPKKKLTIYDLNQLIFPFDPIRDWVEKKVKRINEKYAWAEEL